MYIIRGITKKKKQTKTLHTLYIGNGNTKHQNYIEILIIKKKTPFFFLQEIDWINTFVKESLSQNIHISL